MNNMQNMQSFRVEGCCLSLVGQQLFLPLFCANIYFIGLTD